MEKGSSEWKKCEYSHEIGELSEEGAHGDDQEAGPDAPYEAHEDRDDFMTEELNQGKITDEWSGSGEVEAYVPAGKR